MHSVKGVPGARDWIRPLKLDLIAFCLALVELGLFFPRVISDFEGDRVAVNFAVLNRPLLEAWYTSWSTVVPRADLAAEFVSVRVKHQRWVAVVAAGRYRGIALPGAADIGRQGR